MGASCSEVDVDVTSLEETKILLLVERSFDRLQIP